MAKDFELVAYRRTALPDARIIELVQRHAPDVELVRHGASSSTPRHWPTSIPMPTITPPSRRAPGPGRSAARSASTTSRARTFTTARCRACSPPVAFSADRFVMTLADD
jgi:hypothetical protein